jgi:hypothetical protein
MLGEDDLLISGLVCVATSFLTIMGALLVAESFMLSIPPSAQKETKRFPLRNLSISNKVQSIVF